MSVVLWALLAVPTAGGALLVGGWRLDGHAPAVALLLAAAVSGLAVACAVGRPQVQAPFLSGLPLAAGVDGLSAWMVVTVASVALVVLWVARYEIGPAQARGRFFGLMLLFTGSMLTTVTARSLPLLIMGWEVMGAVSWALIGYWWREPRRTRAAATAFLTTRAADLGLYLAAGAALAGGPSRSLALDGLSGARQPWLDLITAGMIAAALGKSAQLPFSFWLSGAMQGPSPVSALLHSATMVAAGAYLLLRIHPLLTVSGWGADAVAWAGAVTALVLGLVALAQTDLKQLLAASTCAQIGFMVLAAGVGALTGGTEQLVAHAAVKSMLFLLSGLWLNALGTKELAGLRGVARRWPAAGALFTVGALTLAGLPPLALWAAKDLLLASALQHSPALYAVGLTAALVSALYSVRMLRTVWRPEAEADESRWDREERGTRRVPGWALAALVAPALAGAALSVLAWPPLRDDVSVGGVVPVGPTAWELVLSGSIACAAVGVGWAWRGRGPRVPKTVRSAFAGWLGLERAARTLVVGPVLAVAAATAWFDDRVLGRAVDALGPATVRLARWTARTPERGLENAVAALAAGAGALGRLARRPQTGLIHQYLAQAVTAIVLLALVFVLVP